MRGWLQTRRLGRYQAQFWEEARYLDRLYMLLDIVVAFQDGLNHCIKREQSNG